jgi:hypothetical protein
MKFHVLVQLEHVAQVVGADGPELCEVPDDVRIGLAVELEQRGVVRRDRVEVAKRRVRVAIVIGLLGYHLRGLLR